MLGQLPDVRCPGECRSAESVNARQVPCFLHRFVRMGPMRITEAAQRLGTSPRMLRYRETLGLLPPTREHSGHRRFGEVELRAVALALELEKKYDISPAELAFGVRVLADPDVRARVRDLGERIG